MLPCKNTPSFLEYIPNQIFANKMYINNNIMPDKQRKKSRTKSRRRTRNRTPRKSRRRKKSKKGGARRRGSPFRKLSSSFRKISPNIRQSANKLRRSASGAWGKTKQFRQGLSDVSGVNISAKPLKAQAQSQMQSLFGSQMQPQQQPQMPQLPQMQPRMQPAQPPQMQSSFVPQNIPPPQNRPYAQFAEIPSDISGAVCLQPHQIQAAMQILPPGAIAQLKHFGIIP